jgi:hypothetical protein
MSNTTTSTADTAAENGGEESQQDQFLEDVHNFMKQRGYALFTFASLCILIFYISTPIPPAPSFGGHPFDLQALYKHVTDRGGLENVRYAHAQNKIPSLFIYFIYLLIFQVLKEKLWNSIVQLVELPPDCPNPAYTLRVLYLKYLYPTIKGTSNFYFKHKPNYTRKKLFIF